MWLIVYSNKHPSPNWWWRPGLGSGFCGGFTTYSAFAIQVQGYLADGNPSAALSYITASLVGSYLIATFVHRVAS